MMTFVTDFVKYMTKCAVLSNSSMIHKSMSFMKHQLRIANNFLKALTTKQNFTKYTCSIIYLKLAITQADTDSENVVH